MNVSDVVPDPDAKFTTLSVEPVSRVSCGVPVTVTASEKVTWIETVPPTVTVPLVVDDVTFDTVGLAVSTMCADCVVTAE